MNTRILSVTRIPESECIKIDYILNLPGSPNVRKTDWVYTKGLGDWTCINFEPWDWVTVDSFLNTMVVKNTDTLRKMCSILLKDIGYDYWEFMYLIPILDPTFEPPRINHGCRWQRELADSLVSEHFFGVINTCKNNTRLYELYNELVQVVKYNKRK